MHGYYWSISIHVHPTHTREFDRIYAYLPDGKNGQSETFIGAVNRFGMWSGYKPSSEVTRPNCQSGEGHFCIEYSWNDEKSIIVRSKTGKESLRVNPGNNEQANAAGHLFGLARWTVT